MSSVAWAYHQRFQTGLNGKYWIQKRRSHVGKRRLYQSLELTFKNVMDVQQKTKSRTQAVRLAFILLEDVLNQARAWLGVTENPPGSNHNEITRYYALECGVVLMFIWAILNKSGHGNLFMGGGKTAYCFDVMDWYKARGKWGSTQKKVHL